MSHPHQIEITVSSGHVVLAGHVLESELIPLLTTVEAVAGVLSVKNMVTVHQSPNDVLTLQPRTPDAHHRSAPLAAAALGGVAVGVLLASVPWRRLALPAEPHELEPPDEIY
ncbi:MAG TPA: BON domain-containing protein [Vicinamibacterales bacterium]|nr:BON domain-containing protein [Vicinamibacterales bacterium]